MHNINTEMRITLDLPEDLLYNLTMFSKTRNRKEAVRIALEEFVRHEKIEKLLALPGKIKISDVTGELEENELGESRDESTT